MNTRCDQGVFCDPHTERWPVETDPTAGASFPQARRRVLTVRPRASAEKAAQDV